MGAPSLGRGDGGGPLDRDGLLMKGFKTAGLIGHAFGFELPGFGVGDRDGRPRLGRPGAPPREIERVPAQAKPAPHGREGDDHGQHQNDPTSGREDAQDRHRPHGNTVRSSSKCGPSRRVVQSPPQTIGVP